MEGGSTGGGGGVMSLGGEWCGELSSKGGRQGGGPMQKASSASLTNLDWRSASLQC